MPFVLLLLVALVYIQPRWPAPPFGFSSLDSALLTWLIVVGSLLINWFMVHGTCNKMQLQPERCSVLLRRHFRYRRWQLFASILIFIGCLYLGGWGWTSKTLFTHGGNTWPGAELFMLLPFVAIMTLSWFQFYNVERTIHALVSPENPNMALSRWNYLELHTRQSLILVLPPLILLLAQQILVSVFPQLEGSEVLMAIFCGALLGLIFVGQPWLLRMLLALKPLPDDDLRQRLLLLANRLGFRCRNIMVWNTRGTMATALLTGPIPGFRYVILTDHLIANMEPEELEAVFAHEMGHIKHHHMVFYLLFLLLSLCVLTAAGHWLVQILHLEGLDTWLADRLPWLTLDQAYVEWAVVSGFLVALAAYVFLVFGMISRACERQADVFACRMTSWPVFICVLEKVAWLNGMSRDRPGLLASWQHGTIAQRVEFLERLQSQPNLCRRFQQEIRIMCWGIMLILGTLLLLLGPERLGSVLGKI